MYKHIYLILRTWALSVFYLFVVLKLVANFLNRFIDIDLLSIREKLSTADA